MKKKLFYIFFLLPFLSCNSYLENINMDEDNPEDVGVDFLLTNAQVSLFQRLGGYEEGFIGVFTQHFAGGKAIGVNFDQYNVNNAQRQELFTTLYAEGLKDLDVIIEKAEDAGIRNYEGVAKILTGWALGFLTDLFGDIPWSEALQSELTLTPAYDSQQDIYGQIQMLLDEGIAALGSGLGDVPMGQNDIIFKGDTGKWRATAFALKARYYNHLSKKDPEVSAQNALMAIDSAKSIGFTSTIADFMIPHEGIPGHRNSWFELFLNPQIVAGKNFIEKMVEENDPRLEAYWDDVNVGGNLVGYSGKQNGLGSNNNQFAVVGPNGIYGKADAPVLILPFFELLFIEAEAAARLGNFGRAANALNQAVAVQVNQISDASIPSVPQRIQSYINTFGSETANSISLEKIMTEKYKALFTMELETWTDLRRHDFAYPKTLVLPTDADGTQLADEFIRRLPYPQSELDFNSNNVPSSNIFDRVWWDR